MQRQRAISIAAWSVPVALLMLSSCSQSGNEASAASAAPITLSGLPTPTPSVTTVAPTTEAPTTTEQPTTTTEAPTTTAAPTTTLPPNVEVVGAFPTPLEAVGQRSGEATKLIQMRLSQLGFWLSAADGKYGLTTKQAVMAFQKYIGLPATAEVDAATAAYLTNFPEKAHGLTDSGTLVEVDKARQLVFIVVDGKTQWAFNTSTANGKPYEEEDKNTPGEIIKGVAITPDGLFKVNRERPEGWWEGDLGEIYRPKYFNGGIALHGSNSIPNYPASHGCVRLSVPAMDFVWASGLVPKGMTVWVHS